MATIKEVLEICECFFPPPNKCNVIFKTRSGGANNAKRHDSMVQKFVVLHTLNYVAPQAMDQETVLVKKKRKENTALKYFSLTSTSEDVCNTCTVC